MSTPRLRPRARLRLCITTTVLILACLTAVAGSSHASEWKGRAMLAVDYQGWSDLENPNGEFDVLHPSVNVLASRRHVPPATNETVTMLSRRLLQAVTEGGSTVT